MTTIPKRTDEEIVAEILSYYDELGVDFATSYYMDDDEKPTRCCSVGVIMLHDGHQHTYHKTPIYPLLKAHGISEAMALGIFAGNDEAHYVTEKDWELKSPDRLRSKHHEYLRGAAIGARVRETMLARKHSREVGAG